MSTVQKILVADDSLTIRKLVETVLSQEGYEVITAENGTECLGKAAQEKPDIILLDYILPDMQGTEVCRSLINSPETWEIPVLMMSSNGNAIRQLYQDLNNVADYLTKPFAPNVLRSVVSHHLQSKKPAAGGETSANATTQGQPAEAPAAPAAPAVPVEFMDKVNRLLHLMENPAPVAAKAPVAEKVIAVAPVAAPRPKVVRRKSVVTVPMAEAVERKFRTALKKHLRARVRQIPDWETLRGTENAEEFFLSKLLNRETLRELGQEMVHATGMAPDSEGALRCPASLLPLDAVLRHLNVTRATGELRVQMNEETVLVCLDSGNIVLITTNHPRNYCVGAACDFNAISHVVIGQSVRAQEEQSIPFFISLHTAGQLPAGISLDQILQAQGERCLARAFLSREAVATFFPLAKLPALARTYRLNTSFNQLLLACYRTVDDWFTLEKTLSDMDAILVLVPEVADQLCDLKLDASESLLLEAVRNGRTVPELSELLKLKSFEVCRILFRFIKLGLVRQGPRRNWDDHLEAMMPSTSVSHAMQPKESLVKEIALAAPENTPSPTPVAPEEHCETPVVTPEVHCETPAVTPEVQCETPVVAPELHCETPVVTPDAPCETPAVAPEANVETPAVTPEVHCETPAVVPVSNGTLTEVLPVAESSAWTQEGSQPVISTSSSVVEPMATEPAAVPA